MRELPSVSTPIGNIEDLHAEHEAVNIFDHWLYTQQLPLTSHMIAHISGDEREHASSLALVKVDALSNRLLALGFRRAVNNHIVGPYGGIAIASRAMPLPSTVLSRTYPANGHCFSFS